jgi:hypothetical protein
MKKITTQKLIWNLLFVFLIIILLTSCANKENVELCLKGHKYGFLGGFWHGIIAPFDLIAMLFRNDVTVYAQNNTGGWYALGFIIGSGGWGFIGGKGIFRNKRNR